MKRQPTVRLPPRHTQNGFLLPQLAIAVLVGSVVMAYVGNRYWQGVIDLSRDESARMVGTQLSTVNDATKTYATTFFTQIQRGQGVTRNGYTLDANRLLAPTLADLNSLGFLPSRAMNPVVYNGQEIGFNVNLQVDTQSGCTIPTCNLQFQVTTSAPLLMPGSNAQIDVRRATLAAATASPANAGVSLPASMGGDPALFVGKSGNPIGTNAGAVAGLVSIRNGYDSSGFMEFDRRDGSLPRTGDINMQDSSGAKHNINNAGTVTADASVTGTLQVTGIAREGDPCTQLGLIAANSGGKLLGCNGIQWGKATDMPNAHRYVFTSSTTWTVPSGVKSAMVTMAGGGGSGSGWRFASQYITGHSGGFVFSAPVNLIEGEELNIVVGRAAMAYSPVSSDGQVYLPPSGDDGLAGYPGGTTQLFSPSQGLLLQCGGGSGATFSAYNSLDTGVRIPGPQNGAWTFGPPYSGVIPSRMSDAPYSLPNGPGACGPDDYGRGNYGAMFWATTPSTSLNSGEYPGALTPFGYGSGGSISASGCYISANEAGTCVSPRSPRDGVVMIDILY
ncbi:hypothetical protein K5D42_25175 [Pseudomonas cichorii]|nr:hypothetical protein [Pseudomonas cichorii]MBX8493166.1 hypothetical protein [Pseudomonas cichorii]